MTWTMYSSLLIAFHQCSEHAHCSKVHPLSASSSCCLCLYHHPQVDSFCCQLSLPALNIRIPCPVKCGAMKSLRCSRTVHIIPSQSTSSRILSQVVQTTPFRMLTHKYIWARKGWDSSFQSPLHPWSPCIIWRGILS